MNFGNDYLSFFQCIWDFSTAIITMWAAVLSVCTRRRRWTIAVIITTIYVGLFLQLWTVILCCVVSWSPLVSWGFSIFPIAIMKQVSVKSASTGSIWHEISIRFSGVIWKFQLKVLWHCFRDRSSLSMLMHKAGRVGRTFGRQEFQPYPIFLCFPPFKSQWAVISNQLFNTIYNFHKSRDSVNHVTCLLRHGEEFRGGNVKKPVFLKCQHSPMHRRHCDRRNSDLFDSLRSSTGNSLCLVNG